MVLTYKECIERFGSDYMIKKQISKGKLFQKDKGLYSDKELCSDLELIVAKYPRAVFTGESAYYYYGFTDVMLDYYCLATKRGDTRIKDKLIKQTFVKDELYEFGKCVMEYQNMNISIYSRERLLVDLVRFKNKIPFDYYKEVISNYRRSVYELDFFGIEDYAGMLKHGKKIMDAIQLEVLWWTYYVEIKKVKSEGYGEANAQARVCQDIILYGISKGSLSRNVTIKGGIVMRNISKNARRATQDID